MIDSIARAWNLAPVDRVSGSERSGICAALWTAGKDEFREFDLEPNGRTVSLGFRLTDANVDVHINGRAVHAGPARAGTTMLLGAADALHVVARGGWRSLHVYLPSSLLEALAPGDVADRIASDPVLDDPVMFRCGREVLAEMRGGLPLMQMRVDCLVQDLAIHLARRHRHDPSDAIDADLTRLGRSHWRMRRMIRMLDDRIGEDLSVADLAAAAGVSAVHLTTLFRKATGMPPHRWLLRRRVDRARDLLARTDGTVADVAVRCGFSSPQHLASAFRRFLATTPSGYRRSVRD